MIVVGNSYFKFNFLLV